MTSIDMIRNRVQRVFDINPNIHINVHVPHTKTDKYNVPAVIIGVYPRFLRVEEASEGVKHSHTVQYSDIYTGKIEIAELKMGR